MPRVIFNNKINNKKNNVIINSDMIIMDESQQIIIRIIDSCVVVDKTKVRSRNEK